MRISAKDCSEYGKVADILVETEESSNGYDIKVGDAYVGMRNGSLGWFYSIATRITDGVILGSGDIYPFGINECLKVKEVKHEENRA